MSMTIIHDSLSPALRKAAAALRDKKPVLEAMAFLVENAARRSFNDPSQRATPWAPLSSKTIAQKRRHNERPDTIKISTALMKRTTHLWHSWHTLVTSQHAIISSTATTKKGQFYAVFHQFGTNNGIPARPMLPYIGQGDSAQLAPFIRQKIENVAMAKIASLLRQKAGISTS
ncbi:phage virion morphogenesis protein [Geminisphaera colitermitum]|uniref:phage virion morphogenesis protein n=1 Tax=Geminisphaera colitermitum TaxID=1148786 RepID=UPI000158D628|nr:phage virion morphogenesis protein [Geminisphaera colitermitum]